jgi:hypothetical protein
MLIGGEQELYFRTEVRMRLACRVKIGGPGGSVLL